MKREQQAREGSRRLRPLNEGSLRALALTYVGRFATTRARLTAYLFRKLRERGWSVDGEPPVDEVVADFVRLGYVDDDQFARHRTDSLLRRGYGPIRVDAALRHAGIAPEVAASQSMIGPEEEMAAAIALARRKRIGPFCQTGMDIRTRQQGLSVLARAGHRYEIARAVIDGKFPEMNQDEC
jgi:regulatory protein